MPGAGHLVSGDTKQAALSGTSDLDMDSNPGTTDTATVIIDSETGASIEDAREFGSHAPG
jgi:hypothetical protein